MNGKNTEKYGHVRKKKLVILIFLTKHSSQEYSACHKLLNMQNITFNVNMNAPD